MVNDFNPLIRPMVSVADMRSVETLQRSVWPGSETEILPAHILLAIAHHGGVVLGAFQGDRLADFVLSFLGTDSDSPNRVAMVRLKHYSHMLGVHPDFRNLGLGVRLKIAQRQAVVRQGIRLVTWTYDPLLSVNGHINIRRLGAICNRYVRDAYGEMRDGLNVGVASDRFDVDWWVTSSRVVSRIDRARPGLDLANYLNGGVQKLNPARLEEQGRLYPADSWDEPSGAWVLVEIPADFLTIKRLDLALAHAWRMQTRDIFESLFTSGYIVTDFVHLQGERYPRSYYVLVHGEETLG